MCVGGGVNAYFAYRKYFKGNNKENERKSHIFLLYPMLTLHTMHGMRILCMPKNLERKSRTKSKNVKVGNFMSRACIYVYGAGGGGKLHTLHTENILREIIKKVKENHIFACYTRCLLFIPCLVCAYFAYQKYFKGNNKENKRKP